MHLWVNCTSTFKNSKFFLRKLGVFPDDLKIAVVSPVNKTKDPMYFNNYRPISLLSVFSKILERLMSNRLLKFIDKNNLLNEFQFGFRNNHLTFMALRVLMENLVTALDSGDCAIGLFLDFKKRLTKFTIIYYLTNFSLMVFVESHTLGLIATYQTVCNQWITMARSQTSKWWNVVFPKAPSWAHYHFWFI